MSAELSDSIISGLCGVHVTSAAPPRAIWVTRKARHSFQWFQMLRLCAACGWLFWAGCAGADPGSISPSDTLTPGATYSSLLAWVDAYHPSLRAAQAASDAAGARIVSARALADPMLRMELMGINRNEPRFLPAQVGQTRYTMLQSVPLGGKRGLREDAARADADATDERITQVRFDLHAQLRTAFVDYLSSFEKERINRDVLGLLKDIEQVALTRYAAGATPQQDVIKAQIEQTRITAELIAIDKERADSSARLNALLARPANAALQTPTEWPAVPHGAVDFASLSARVERQNPMIAEQDATRRASRYRETLARRGWIPDLTVGVSPVQVGSRLDSWELMFEVNIPLQVGRRRAEIREATAMANEADARRETEQLRITSALSSAIAAYDSARERLKLVEKTLIPQADVGLFAAQAGYQTAQVDFQTLVEAERQIREARLIALEARREQQAQFALIESLVGGTL
ncbi:MAG: TolC family protein [Betaproteobacteria bacterium]